MFDVDALAQEIRRVNGDNTMGAGELAEAIAAWNRRTAPVVTEAMVDAAAEQLRNITQAGRLFGPWDRVSKAAKKKWLNLARAALSAAYGAKE